MQLILDLGPSELRDILEAYHRVPLSVRHSLEFFIWSQCKDAQVKP